MADPRFKHLELKVGLFIIVSMALMVTIIVGFAVSKNLFTPKVRVRILSETGEGITKGMPVKYSGFQISRIDQITLEDNGNVVLLTNIPKKYTKWIRKNSAFRLNQQTFIGSSSIVIAGSDLDAPIVEPGDTFILDREGGLQELISKAQPVLDDAKRIVANFAEITDRFANPEGDFNRFMEGLGELGNDLENKEGSLGYLARTDYVRGRVENIARDLDAIGDNLTVFSQKMNTFGNRVNNETLTNLNDAITEIQHVANNLAKGTDNITEVRRDAEILLDMSNRLLNNLQTKWPFTSGEGLPNRVDLP